MLTWIDQKHSTMARVHKTAWSDCEAADLGDRRIPSVHPMQWTEHPKLLPEDLELETQMLLLVVTSHEWVQLRNVPDGVHLAH